MFLEALELGSKVFAKKEQNEWHKHFLGDYVYMCLKDKNLFFFQ